MTIRALRIGAPIAAAGMAAIGGIVFGLFSCGGYVWHRYLFWALLTPCLVLTGLFPPPVLRPVPRRFVVIAAVVAGFVVIRGAVSTFYPGSPESLMDFVRGTWLGITTGPC